MFQTKEQDKTPKEELSEVEVGNLHNKEFKVTMIRMLKELRRRMDEHSEKMNKESENTKKNQTELKNTITEMKSTREGINRRLDDTEGWICKLEDRVVQTTQTEEKKEKRIF